MAEPNGAMLTVGAGTLWSAPIGTTEPVAGVLTPSAASITAGAASVAWPTGWIQMGYTTDGSEFDWAPKLDPLEVAEVLVPIRFVTASAEAKVMFACAEITAAHVKAAFNGGTVATAAGITTFTPPNVGQEVRLMLGWDRIDGMERILWRQCIQTGTVKQTHKKAPAMNTLPMEFSQEWPTNNTAPFVHYFDGTLVAA